MLPYHFFSIKNILHFFAISQLQHVKLLNLLNFSENKNDARDKKTEEEYFLEYYSKLTISQNETDKASYSKIPRFYFKVS